MDPTENQHLQHERSEQRQQEREAARRRIEEGEEPWKNESGVMSVVDAVRDLEFPLKPEDIESKAGDRKVRTSENNEMPLSTVLSKLKEDQFFSIRDFQTAVQKHWQGVQFEEVPADQRPEQGGFQPQQRD